MTTTPAAAGTQFDLDRGWRLSESVALRPEPFGALAYHFETRKLSFLKSRKLVALVERLGEQETARAACDAAGVAAPELRVYEQALARLAESGMIRERSAE